GHHVHAGHLDPVEPVVPIAGPAADPQVQADRAAGRQLLAHLGVDDPHGLVPPRPAVARSIPRRYSRAARWTGSGVVHPGASWAWRKCLAASATSPHSR